MLTAVLLSSHPMNVNETMHNTDSTPTITFQNARYRARGLNFVMTMPATRMPAADEIKAKVPVNIAEADEV
jgi:hypothetical protein